MCTSTSREYTGDGHPEGHEPESYNSPPNLLERRRGAEQKSIEKQERQLDYPKYQVQKTVVDITQAMIIFIEPKEFMLR